MSKLVVNLVDRFLKSNPQLVHIITRFNDNSVL